MRFNIRAAAAIVALTASLGLTPRTASGHCDTMDGPVVTTAIVALGTGDVTPVLKWVKPEYEDQIKSLFRKTLAVRAKGTDARELADMYFFETLVRLHRAGEGVPYTGLKPAGVEVEPSIVAADKALDSGSVDALIEDVTGAVAAGIRQRFEQTVEMKRRADESVSAGREYVAAYVEFIHYVERLHLAVSTNAAHQEEAPAGHGH